MLTLQQTGSQIPLIQIIETDDRILLNSPDTEWYRILYDFPWFDYRDTAAEYYDALYKFNITEAEKRKERFFDAADKDTTETKEEAIQRLLFNRATMQKSKVKEVPVIYKAEVFEPKKLTVKPETIAPGIVPIRLGGRKPKCFFAMFKSFLGASLMGFPSEPETVYLLLGSNPSFIRVCGFAPKEENDEYCYIHVPSLRKLEQFDQIMRDSGLWGRVKLSEVSRNIRKGVIKKENELVGDTTHYHAYSEFETVKYTDENGKEQKKSQSKVTKRCRCEDKNKCNHEWALADDGAGTIVKSSNKMHWGHKASILGLPRQEGFPWMRRQY
jgi:hypothetical protein